MTEIEKDVVELKTNNAVLNNDVKYIKQTVSDILIIIKDIQNIPIKKNYDVNILVISSVFAIIVGAVSVFIGNFIIK
jgi:hypothetical protein